jgi:glycosyltransferase involved in cell wall biosynthesis
MNAPIVSVLVPTYNYARFLGEAIESVLAQDFREFELLVVDDCSTDDTAEVVKSFCSRDARVLFTVNTKRLGMVNNWNHCLEQARGTYVKFLFGDDKFCNPGTLGKMVRMMEERPGITLAASARAILNEKSRTREIWRHFPDGVHEGRDVITSCLAQNQNLIGEPSAVLFRRKDAGRGFDPKLRQIVDLEMWFRLLERGRLAYTREALCGFRQHAQQQTVANFREGLALEEHTRFISDYAFSNRYAHRLFFPQLRQLRRIIRRHPTEVTPAMRVLERELSERFSKNSYAYYFALYKTVNPFKRFARSVRKRVSRARFRLMA